jgi:tubulin polyglutamylase TTLL6/13
MERMQKVFPQYYNFHPRGFLMPTQALDLIQFLQSPGKPRTFIVKPDLGAQGRGIILIQDPDAVLDCRESAIAQEYISPYLIDGLKFDLRIYVLISSVDPLRIYIFKEGIARFCTELYRPPDANNLTEIYRHLTNYSLNKHNPHFQQSSVIEGSDNQSHKRSLTCVLTELQALGFDAVELRAEIERIIVLTILAVQPFLQHNYRASFKTEDGKSRCFEILGFDILIDEYLKPWVLEVNHSPSLACDSGFDAELKDRVISGALRIIDIHPKFMETMLTNEKTKTMQRIAGNQARMSTGNVKTYSFDRENELSRSTDWKLIYPASEQSEFEGIYEEVVAAHRRMGMGGMDETQASSKRKLANLQYLHEIEERHAPPKKVPGKVIVSKFPTVTTPPAPGRPTKSVLLLREAKIAKMKEDSKRESIFLFTPEYEKFVKQEVENRMAVVRHGKVE